LDKSLEKKIEEEERFVKGKKSTGKKVNRKKSSQEYERTACKKYLTLLYKTI